MTALFFYMLCQGTPEIEKQVQCIKNIVIHIWKNSSICQYPFVYSGEVRQCDGDTEVISPRTQYNDPDQGSKLNHPASHSLNPSAKIEVENIL